MYIVRATTPTIRFKLPFDTSTCSKILLTFKQCNRIILNKTEDNLILDGEYITLVLTQQETKLFTKGKGELQCRILQLSNFAPTSKSISFDVFDVLNDVLLSKERPQPQEGEKSSGCFYISEQLINLDYGLFYNIAGYEQKGEYNSETQYSAGNVVTYRGSSYISKKKVKGIAPTDEEYWQLVSRGFYNTGNYNSETYYYINDVVSYKYATYIAKKESIGILPTNEEYWSVFSARGEIGPYYFPHISDNGVLYWTNDAGLPNPDPVNIKEMVVESIQPVLDKKIDEDNFITNAEIDEIFE